jgi:hypothetical protein
MNKKHEALQSLEKCTSYALCTMILSNLLHLTIRSNLSLIQNVVMHILKFFLMFMISKRCMPSRFQLISYLLYLLYITFLGERVKTHFDDPFWDILGSIIIVYIL